MNVVEYQSAGVSIRAEQFGPAGAPPVIIAHGSDGITDHLNGPWATTMRGFAQAFADAGRRVLIPYYFEKTGTEPGPAAMQSMFGHMAAWQQAIADAAGFAGGAAALVGFSLGGHLVLRLRGSVPAVVAFFAPLLTGLGASPAAGTRVEIHHGESDRLVDIRQADRIASQLISEGTPVEVHRYANAGHGFSGAHPGDAEALNRSRSLTIAFATAPSSYELHTTAGDGC